MSSSDSSIRRSSCKLVHHGAAATSSSKVLTWLPPLQSASTSPPIVKTLVYASHAMINVARPMTVQLYGQHQQQHQQQQQQHNHHEESVWNVTETLRTRCSYSISPTVPVPTITTLTYLGPMGRMPPNNNTVNTCVTPTLACGFSNGSLTVWNRTGSNSEWEEQVLVDAIQPPTTTTTTTTTEQDEAPRSWTDLNGVVFYSNSNNDNQRVVLLAACSSAGVTCVSYAPPTVDQQKNDALALQLQLQRRLVTHHTACAVQWQALSDTTLLLLIGTAAPRHNKIMVYSVPIGVPENDELLVPTFHFCGALTGHEDWITDFAWKSLTTTTLNGSYMLASASQDFKIRLWKFTTTTVTATATATNELTAQDATTTDTSDIDDEDDNNNVQDEEDFEEHESRLEILWQQQSSLASTTTTTTTTTSTTTNMQTSVSLEALLLGHEGPVTAVHWYPTANNNKTDANEQQSSFIDNHILVSSSMDRSILLWSPSEEDGIWTPITRVGSAGGILGGSIGSTLLGYVNVQIQAQWMVGHAYGGALHIWHNPASSSSTTSSGSSASDHYWKATPCITGHFDGVTDLCWESTFGDYLLTVSLDQTCRLWAPVEATTAAAKGDTESDDAISKGPGVVWVEVARPQVHGYSLSAVTSLSSPRHRHWIVSGADEKELRILDAPMTTVRMLKAIQPATAAATVQQDDKENTENNVDATERVERAYIPSLGLSNKATAADGAEEDVQDDNDITLQKNVYIPSERDLGALSLWLETRKLFGHNTELYCVTSNLEAKTAFNRYPSQPSNEDELILVASAAKARDVEAAGIRIWNPQNGACLQTLSGGHKATVATLSFSPDGGKYLASSGKDRRLCIWKQNASASDRPGDVYHLAAAKDSAHKRIIWSVHFCPYDPSVLASGSRDGNVKIWKLSDSEDGETVTMDQVFSFSPTTLNPIGKPDAVTALAFAPKPLDQKDQALLALGFECGLIELWSIPVTVDGTVPEASPKLLQCFPQNLCHIATVTKLAWRPLCQSDHTQLTLASGSSDHGCRIFQVDIESFPL